MTPALLGNGTVVGHPTGMGWGMGNTGWHNDSSMGGGEAVELHQAGTVSQPQPWNRTGRPGGQWRRSVRSKVGAGMACCPGMGARWWVCLEQEGVPPVVCTMG